MRNRSVLDKLSSRKLKDLEGSIRLTILDNLRVKLEVPYDVVEDFLYYDYVMKYNYWEKKMVPTETHAYLGTVTYENKVTTVIIGTGFIGYLIKHYDQRQLSDGSIINLMNQEDRKKAVEFYTSDLQVPYFPGLYSNQNEDLQCLLKYKKGLFQCYTGYGKTQVIATLINYITTVLNETVAVMVPSVKVYDELKDRYQDLSGVKLKERFNPDRMVNIFVVNGTLRRKDFDYNSPFHKRVKWVLGDEIEYSVNSSGMTIMNLFTNAIYWYGFSATADKKRGERITPKLVNSPVITRNKDIISYFGVANVYGKPDDVVVNFVTVSTDAFNDIKIKLKKGGNDYHDILFQLFTNDNVCKLIAKISRYESPMFIPFQFLEVIDNWVTNYFNKPSDRVIVICSRGYEYYVGGVLDRYLTLSEVKDELKDGNVTAVLGTSSSYRALDFHGMSNIMLLTSALAGVVIQSVGRIARDNKFNVFYLEPTNQIQMYSTDLIRRKSLVEGYYSECTKKYTVYSEYKYI